MLSILLTMIFTCLTFFALGEFGLSVYGSCFLVRSLSNHSQRLGHTFCEICTTFDAHSLSHSSRNRIRTDTGLQIKRHKISTHTPSCVKFCTQASKMCQYYRLSLHRATTTVAQMTAPIPKIMDARRMF
jgi:hypothetical protein